MRNMKKIFLLISAILLIVPVQAQHTLRLMTYNIKNAELQQSLERTRRLRPDLLGE